MVQMKPPTSSSKEHQVNTKNVDLVEKIPSQDIPSVDTSTSSISFHTSSDASSSGVMISSPSVSSLQYVSPSESIEATSPDPLKVKVVGPYFPFDVRDAATPDRIVSFAEFNYHLKSGKITNYSGTIDEQQARNYFRGATDNEEDTPIQSAAQIQEEMDAGKGDVLIFGSQDREAMFVQDPRFNRPDSSNISASASGERLSDDAQPYPPWSEGHQPVSPFSTSNTLPVIGTTIPRPSVGSVESVLEIPSQVDVAGEPHQEPDDTQKIMREMESVMNDEERSQWHYSQQFKQVLPVGFEVNYLSDRPIADADALRSMMRPYIQGQQGSASQQVPVQFSQTQAPTQTTRDFLEARHHARVANNRFEDHNRTRGFRDRFEHRDNGGAKIVDITDQERNAQTGVTTSGASSIPGLAKGLPKRPSKPKNKAAKIMALRNTKPSRSNAPVPVRNRVPSTKQHDSNLSSSSVTKVPTPSSGEQVKSQTIPSLLLFHSPVCEERTVQTTYGRNSGKAKPTELALTIDSDSQSTNQSTIEEVETYTEDDQSDEVTDADDEDPRTFGTDSFDSLQSSPEYDVASQIQQHENAILERLYAILWDFRNSINYDCVLRLHNVDGVVPVNHHLPVGSSMNNAALTNKFKDVMGIAREIWGNRQEALTQSLRLLRSNEFVSKVEDLFEDETVTVELLKLIQHHLTETHQSRDNHYKRQAFSDAIEDDRDKHDYSFKADLATDGPSAKIQNTSMPHKVFDQTQSDAVNVASTNHSSNGIASNANVQKPSDLDDSWMEPTPAFVPVAKKKKNKGKKNKSAGTGSNVPASAGYFGTYKENATNTGRTNDSGSLKASLSMVSQADTELSSAEPIVRSAFATTNIFDQLKRTDLEEGQSPSPETSHEQGLVKLPGTTTQMKLTNVPNLTASPDRKMDQERPVGDDSLWVDAALAESWADTEVTSALSPVHEAQSTDVPLASSFEPASTVEPEMPTPTLQVASTGTASGQGAVPKRRLFFKPRWGNANQHGQRKPFHTANTEITSNNAQGSVDDKTATTETSAAHQTRTNTLGRPRLSYRDMHDGATIELHPIKVFVAGVPYYDETVVPWQNIRSFIISHFKKFGNVVKVKAVRDTNSTGGHVNAFIMYSNREDADKVIEDSQSRIITVPAIPNSYDLRNEPLKILAKEDIDGQPFMDVRVRLEKAQGIRRIYFHITGMRPEEAGKTGLNTLPRWLTPLPEAITFESYLDPFGTDTYGREKFRLRKRLRIESPPYEQEVYKRRNQVFYPGDEPITVHLDPKDSEEVSIRRLCAVFGELEELRPWTPRGKDGYEAVFYDRECAIRALNQLRMIPGVSAFWSHEKQVPKPSLQVSSLLPPTSGTVGMSAAAPSDVAIQIKDSPEATVPNNFQEEWPVLPVSNNKKKCVELPAPGSPPPLAPPGLLEFPPVGVDRCSEAQKTAQPAFKSTSVLGTVADGLNDKTDRSCIASDVPAATNNKKDPVFQQGKIASEPLTTAIGPVSNNAGKIGQVAEEHAHLNDQGPGADCLVRGQSTSDNMSLPAAQGISVVTSTSPLMPNVRLSPAPSADERMTILVEGLSKDESEDAIKARFKAYGRLVNTNYKQGPKSRCSMSLSYNSVHSARQAAEAENGKMVHGRKQTVKLIQAGRTSKQKKKLRARPILSILPVQAAPDAIAIHTERVDSVSTSTAVQEDCFIAKVSVDVPPGEDLLRVDTSPSPASMGRKRAFSDPGDVKRPSTASTEFPEEDPGTLLANNYQDLQFGDFPRHPHQDDQASHTPPLIQSTYVSTQIPEGYMPVHHSVDNGIGYHGYGYPMYVQPGMLPYHAYPHGMEFESLPLRAAWGGSLESQSLENVLTPAAGSNIHDGIRDVVRREERTSYPAINTLPSNGLNPVKFTQTEYGLMPIYDPQELSRYRKEHGLVSDDGSSRTEPSREPPLALLPLSSGGHSPTHASFQFSPAEELGNQSAEVNETQTFQSHYGDLPVRQPYANPGLPPVMVSAYSASSMFAIDTSMGLSASVHRAPMQLQSQYQHQPKDQSLNQRQPDYSTSSYQSPLTDHNGPPRRAHLQHYSQDTPVNVHTISQPAVYVPQELMMINVPHHMHGFSPNMQPFTFNASPKHLQSSPSSIMNLEKMHSPSSANYASSHSVFPHQTSNVGQRANPREPRTRSQNNQGSAHTPMRPTGQLTSVRGYRQPPIPLPMQSTAFEAYEASRGSGAPPVSFGNGRGRGKGPGAGRKPGFAARGPRLPLPGVYPI
ncbi:hypothetical protein QFC22_001667 [Naganishia vaughanmartiniae]|uniref:Uncharacterized protein n=1 Tax=Naganishia vaughanmartiniae TaxID=1424756 RepID=A0ACC2XG62_9TREE|nr:hypothetical protein QFC22_001667 [Naganishia vaughanmartiniae]